MSVTWHNVSIDPDYSWVRCACGRKFSTEAWGKELARGIGAAHVAAECGVSPALFAIIAEPAS